MAVKYAKSAHKWKKGDTLDALAKHYKHRKGQDIWTAQDNLALRKKRKKPEQIQSGDIIVIPLKAKDAQALGQEVAALQSTMVAEKTVMKTIEAQRKYVEASISAIKKQAQEELKSTKFLIGTIQTSIKRAKNYTDGVDLAWSFFNITKSLTKIIANARKALGKCEKSLRKSNKKNTAIVKDMVTSPMKGEVKKVVYKHLTNIDNGYNRAVVALATVGTSMLKISSPSFWFWTATRLYEGEGWTKAVSTSFDHDAKLKIKKLENLSKYHQELFQIAINEKETCLLHLNSMRNESYKVFRSAEKQLKSLEKLL